jgi:hypothetical protein
VFGVFKIIDPPPLSTQRVCPPPAPKAVYTRRAVRGVGEGFNILEDAKHRIGLLQYNLSVGTGTVKDYVSNLGETLKKLKTYVTLQRIFVPKL